MSIDRYRRALLVADGISFVRPHLAVGADVGIADDIQGSERENPRALLQGR